VDHHWEFMIPPALDRNVFQAYEFTRKLWEMVYGMNVNGCILLFFFFFPHALISGSKLALNITPGERYALTIGGSKSDEPKVDWKPAGAISAAPASDSPSMQPFYSSSCSCVLMLSGSVDSSSERALGEFGAVGEKGPAVAARICGEPPRTGNCHRR
jgi:hypothetical protein